MQQHFVGIIFVLQNCTKHLLRLTETFSSAIYISLPNANSGVIFSDINIESFLELRWVQRSIKWLD